MKLPPILVHILGFILRCGGKLDLTPGDLQRSLTSKGQNIQLQNQKVMKIVYYTIYMIFFVFQKRAKYSKRLMLIKNITPRSCQGYFRVIWRSKYQQIAKISTFNQLKQY